MERVREKYQYACKAAKRFEQAVALYLTRHVRSYGEAELHAFHNSVIKTFEFTYEALISYFKVRLEVSHTLRLERGKEVIAAALEYGLLSHRQTIVLNRMRINRNITSHEYSELVSSEIADHAGDYLILVKGILSEHKAFIEE